MKYGLMNSWCLQVQCLPVWFQTLRVSFLATRASFYSVEIKPWLTYSCGPSSQSFFLF
jgi:hypothetical protein